jgi:hypothetical protein
MEEIRFDDLEACARRWRTGSAPGAQPIEVTQEMINRFADVTGDHQWIHIDVERAKRESPFGTTIAHGFLTLSLLPKLGAGGAWRVTGFGNATNYGADKLRFVSRCPPGLGPRALSAPRRRGEAQGHAADAGDSHSRGGERTSRAHLRDADALPPKIQR